MPAVPQMSPYKKHLALWTGCDKCFLASTRRKMVFARGTIPCDILFIGEAPGESEDVIGKPFVGPAGKLLDDMIDRAIGHRVEFGENAVEELPPLRLAFTNLVCCIPKNPDGKVEPSKECVKACNARLVEFIRLAEPKMVVRVGKLAQKEVGGCMTTPADTLVDVHHPAFVLRMKDEQRGLVIQQTIVTLRDAVDDRFPA